MTGNTIELTLALSDYDHTRDLVSGEVTAGGVALTCLRLPVEEIFWRFTQYREWDVTELSLAKYCWMRGQADDSLIAIPVFTSRAFRHSAIFVRADGPVDDPSALKGGRIGIPEWTQTATVYARGILQDDHGVGLTDVEWVQAGTNEPGRKEGVPVRLPDGVRVASRPDCTLNELLSGGEIEAAIAAHPPTGFRPGGPIVRLFSDPLSVEQAFFRATRVFPIMHVVVLRRDLYERHRWLAMNLFKAFEEARLRSMRRALDLNAPSFPIPWGPAWARSMHDLFGGDPWPYGIEPNRKTLGVFLRWAREQGIVERTLVVDDLFPPEVRTAFVV